MRHLLPRPPAAPPVVQPYLPEESRAGEPLPLERERGGWWGIAQRQRWVIVGCVVAAVILVGAYTWFATPVFEARSTVRIDEKAPAVASLAGLRVSEGQLTTEMEVLRSRSLAESVVRTLDLQVQIIKTRGTGGMVQRWRSASIDRTEIFARLEAPPDADTGTYVLRQEKPGRFTVRLAREEARRLPVRTGEPFRLGRTEVILADGATALGEMRFVIVPLDRAADALRKRLDVRRAGNDANIVNVSFRDPDARLARDVVNAVTGNFINARQQVQKTEARSASEYLRKQLEDVRAELAVAERSLQTFREQEGVVSLPEEASTQVMRLAELQAERNSIAAEREALGTLLEQVEEEARSRRADEESPYRRLLAFPTLLRNPAASELLRTLATVENQRAELLMRRTSQDPDVRQLTTRIGELEEQIRGIGSTYASGLRDQMTSIDATLGRYRQDMADIPAKEAQLARLQREPKVLEEMHALLQSRLKEAEIAQAVEDPSVRVLDAAMVPESPASPRPLFNLAAALVLGLGCGIAGALVREAADRAVHSRREVMVATGLPVLGVVPAVRASVLPTGRRRHGRRTGPRWALPSRGRRSTALAHPVLGADEAPELTEAFHRLVTNIAFARPTEELRVIAVTSALPGDGKTTTAVNLALTLSRRSQRTLLVDGDLRRGGVHQIMRTHRVPGLAEVVRGKATLEDAIRVAVLGDATLDVLAAGAPVAHPAEVIGSPALAPLLASLRERYDVVVVDAPPINAVADPALLGALVDGVVLVVRAGTT
ncbi:MAG TPA: polysaccharide biosynthesis tyrosine autokinase, partial [Gemmatimonadaceae bacterium]|nr:polysaccharide biosynthesis tyrosine autokinase [Gemmatimonadaceae bacterium]